MTNYNLRYNRHEYLNALGPELVKHKVMKFVPSLSVKQQRQMRRSFEKESIEKDTVDLETLMKTVDPHTLRLQMAHRFGIEVNPFF